MHGESIEATLILYWKTHSRDDTQTGSSPIEYVIECELESTVELLASRGADIMPLVVSALILPELPMH